MEALFDARCDEHGYVWRSAAWALGHFQSRSVEAFDRGLKLALGHPNPEVRNKVLECAGYYAVDPEFLHRIQQVSNTDDASEVRSAAAEALLAAHASWSCSGSKVRCGPGAKLTGAPGSSLSDPITMRRYTRRESRPARFTPTAASTPLLDTAPIHLSTTFERSLDGVPARAVIAARTIPTGGPCMSGGSGRRQKALCFLRAGVANARCRDWSRRPHRRARRRIGGCAKSSVRFLASGA